MRFRVCGFFSSLVVPVLVALCIGTPGAALAFDTPEDAVHALVESLRDKDPDAFLKVVDLDSVLDASRAAYYDGTENGVLKNRAYPEVREEFLDSIASGTRAALCKDARASGCPWYPKGLEAGKITKTEENSAYIAVDSEEDIRSWLVLFKTDDGWKVSALPLSLKEAKIFASDEFRKHIAAYRDAIARRDQAYLDEQEQKRIAEENRPRTWDDIWKAYNENKTESEILALYKRVGSLDERTRNGSTFLHLAAQHAHVEAIDWLLKAGLDPNAKDEGERTALWVLAEDREPYKKAPGRIYDSAVLLLDAGTKPVDRDWNYQDIFEHTEAAGQGNTELLKALHDKGFDITRAARNGVNGLHMALRSLYNPTQTARLAEERFTEARERGGNVEAARKLHDAAQADLNRARAAAVTNVRLLLKAGVSPDQGDEAGYTSRRMAENGKVAEIQALMEAVPRKEETP